MTSGATANSYYYDEYYFGNPGLYKTYFVGINDACPYKATNDLRLPFLTSAYTKATFRPEDQAVKAFRADAVANTYAETGPSADQHALEAFQIGASRILTRTAPP